MKKLLFVLTLSFSLIALSFSVKAQFTDLLDFNSGNGSSPYSDLTFSHNKDTLFGMTETGGANGVGCVFSILPNGTGYSDLIDFNTTNGANPYGALTLSGYRLYGMTEAGGANNMGCVFSVQTNGSGYTDLLDFNGENGSYPYGALAFSYTGDSLFGMTSAGGIYSYGTIFSVDNNGSNYTDLHDFNSTDGTTPYGSLTLAHTTHRLYGMTSTGGTSSYGDIFTINTDGSGFTDLLNFNNENGAAPIGSLIPSVSGDTLYGFTSQGGPGGYGSLFSLVDGDVFTDLYTFAGADGYSPDGDVTLANGLLYGMTLQGGYGGGNVFSVYNDGSNFTNLLNFNSANGAYPYGSLTFLNTTLYGMTSQGGANNDGLIFSFNILAVDSFQVAGVSCADSYLGSATAYPAGGTSPYTYSWSDGGTTQTESGLTAGAYTVTVTDGLGSTATSVTIISGLSVAISEVGNVSCNRGSDGSITVSASGGTGTYVYSWDGLPPGIVSSYTGPRIELPGYTGLPAGTYTITVKDWCGDSVFVLGTITQPDPLVVSTTPSLSNICAGASATLTTSLSGGTSPYTYSWSPSTYLSCSDCPNPVATPPHSIIDTVTVTDNNGCTNFTVDTIVVHSLPTAPSIVAIGTDSINFTVTKPDSTLRYSWRLHDITGNYSDTGDTAHLPVWPRNAFLTYYNTSIAGCIASDSIRITHSAPLPVWGDPYPRWSKRGVDLEFACHYFTPFGTGGNIGAADSMAVNGTPFVTYCRNNHITYVLMDGVDYHPGGPPYGNSCGVFYQDSSNYDTTNARYFENFIDSLKTRGGVQEIGVYCYKSDTAYPNDNSYSVLHCANVVAGIHSHNLGLPWEKKVDVLDMDYEFWNADSAIGVNAFHNTVMPMLRSMSAAAKECDTGFLRVECYVGEPLCHANASSFDINYSIDTMEADSMSLYVDRILNSSYSVWNVALWNEADFRLAYPNFGDHRNKNMEIWPIFSAENYDSGTCQKCYYQIGNDFSGADLCPMGLVNKAEWIEAQYWDSLNFSAKHKEFTSSITNPAPMGADTNFRILGDMWYDYNALKTEGISFDTLSSGYLKWYVTVGHDIQWLHISVPFPITVTATVHGGVGPFTYTWYNMSNGLPLLHGVGSAYQSYTDYYSVRNNYYNVSRVAVIVGNAANDSAVTDYMNIYQICSQPIYDKPIRKSTPPIDSNIVRTSSIEVYPNPTNSQLNIQFLSAQLQPCYFEMFNIMGQKVKSVELTNRNMLMDVSSLSPGVYFYRGTNLDGSLIKSDKVAIIH